MFSNGKYSETDIGDEVNYVLLAQAYGIEGYRVTNMEELKTVLKTIKPVKKPIIIDCVIDRDEGIYPIVPPGLNSKFSSKIKGGNIMIPTLG